MEDKSNFQGRYSSVFIVDFEHAFPQWFHHSGVYFKDDDDEGFWWF